MAAAPLGFWEVLGSVRVKAPVGCAGCNDLIGQDALRCRWCPFDAAAPECPWYHPRCAARAGEEGATAPLASGGVRKKSGLSRAQLSEVNALLEAAEVAAAASGAATPAKDPPASAAEEPPTAEKQPQPPEDPAPKKKAKKPKKLHDDPHGGPQELAGPAKKKAKAKGACAKPAAGPVADPAAPAAEAGPGAPPLAGAPGAPGGGGGGARHLAGLVPAAAYVPIKDFARSVKPAGTAREVFEHEVVPVFGLKLGPWLSEEAQKVASSILNAGNGGGLTPQMVYSVVLYTLDTRLGGGTLEDNFYSALNMSLQQRDMKVLSKIEGYLYYLMSALEKPAPEPERVFFRGVPKSAYEVVRKNYTSGRRVHWSGISSISEDEQVSTTFAQAEGAVEGNGPGGVVFRITARTGRKIQHLSALPAEAEVLLLPNFRGFVTRGLYRNGKVWSIDILEEADDSGTFVF